MLEQRVGKVHLNDLAPVPLDHCPVGKPCSRRKQRAVLLFGGFNAWQALGDLLEREMESQS